MANKKISELPELEELNDNSEFLINEQNLSFKVLFKTIFTQIYNAVKSAIDTDNEGKFLAKSGKAADSEKLNGKDAEDYATKAYVDDLMKPAEEESQEWAMPKMWIGKFPGLSNYDTVGGTFPVPNLPGYHYCVGQRLKASEYPDLYKIIGKAFDRHPESGAELAEDGYFRLPNFQGRVPIGCGGMPNTLGAAVTPDLYPYSIDNQVGRELGRNNEQLKDARQIPFHKHSFFGDKGDATPEGFKVDITAGNGAEGRAQGAHLWTNKMANGDNSWAKVYTGYDGAAKAYSTMQASVQVWWVMRIKKP